MKTRKPRPITAPYLALDRVYLLLVHGRRFKPDNASKEIAKIIKQDNDRIVAGIESVYGQADGSPDLNPRLPGERAIIKWRLSRRTERKNLHRRIFELSTSE